jgi:integrase
MKPLTALQVKALAKPGVYRASRNLYVQVTEGGKSWMFRYMRDGKARWMGLGSVELVTLADARDLVVQHRRQILLEKIDPLEHRRAERRERLLAKASAITFRECATRYIAAHEAGWRNGKHRQQWQNSLETYGYPVIGELPAAAVETAHVLQVIEPIWHTKPETASRVRGRIESVIDWAHARGYRNGENPARWRGHLQKLLPAKAKVRAVEHHNALPYADVPAFMVTLRQQPGVAARALELTILCAVRTSEAIGARWPEFDLPGRTWTIPAARMKANKPHTVPLSDRAIEILEALPRSGDYVFEGARAGRPLSNMAMVMTLRRMKRDAITVHGFRSTFKDWASEKTSHADIVSEMAMAHTIPDKVQKAYRRGDLLKKRRALMRDWARYCQSKVSEKAEK